MPKIFLFFLFMIAAAMGLRAQKGSFETGASVSSGWISNQLQTSTSQSISAGWYGNWRFSKNFGVESGLQFFGTDREAGSLIGYGLDAGSDFFSFENSLEQAFIEMPFLFRVYVVQRKESPWEVNIDCGYSLMYRFSELTFYQNRPITHNLILGVGVQRMISGPWLLGIILRTSGLDITNPSGYTEQLWTAGLRVGMKLNAKR